MFSEQYAALARKEELAGNVPSALLLYLSSFTAAIDESPSSLSAGTVNKIAMLRSKLSLPAKDFLSSVHGYSDDLTDNDYRRLLINALEGNIKYITDFYERRL